MYSEVHASLGWCLAEASNGDTKLRKWIFLAALLPDLDAITWLFGEDIYFKYHHMLTHGMLFSVILSSLAIYSCKEQSKWKVLLWTQLSFFSHYLGDYFFTRFPMYYFWPFSDATFISENAVPLWHPVNKVFQWVCVVALIGLAVKFKRTPIEVISVKWDQKVISSFRALKH